MTPRYEAAHPAANSGGAEAVGHVHPALRRAADVLIAEFEGLHAPRTVLRHVAQARALLLAAGLRAGLPWATESMARSRLNGLLPPGASAAGADGAS